MSQRPSPQFLFLGVMVALAATALASFADQWCFDRVHMVGVYDHAWGVSLRTMGVIWPWLGLALLAALWEMRPQMGRERVSWKQAAGRGLVVAAAPFIAGAITWVLKHVAHRHRPPATEPAAVTHLFDALFGAARHAAGTPGVDPDVWYSFPSGHATLAFAGAFAMARLYPRTQVAWFALAVGCAFTRLLAHAHHLSDVVFGAGVGFVGAWCAVSAAQLAGVWRENRMKPGR